MTTEPRDDGLKAVVRATVKVANGSGVLIWPPNSAVLIATAAHVVRGRELHRVRKDGFSDERPVIAHDDRFDLALLTAPSGWETAAIELANESDVLPGDGIWAAGYPRGWDGDDPVVAPGTIAGLGLESWVNVDGSWGDSGAPLCRVSPGKVLVAGILLGSTGGASKALDDWVKLFGERAGESRLALEYMRTGGTLTKEAIAEMAAPLKLEALAGQLDASSSAVQIRLLAMMHAVGSTALARLIEDHFRTGFLRFAPVAGIRKLMERRLGGPST